MNSYLIPSELLPGLTKKLNRINKRAAKLAKPPVTMTLTGHTEEREIRMGGTIGTSFGPVHTYTVEEVVVEGSTPIINGWEFVGIIRHKPAGNELVVLGQHDWIERDVRWTGELAFSGRNCDHCHENRVRNATYLLHNAERDELKQVGSSCLGDFTGYNDPQAAATAYENIFKFFHDLKLAQACPASTLGRTTLKFHRTEWMAFVHMMIRQHGWVSGSKAFEIGDTSTKYRAKDAILRYYKGEDQEAPNAEDFKRAEAIIEWTHTDAHTEISEGEFKTQFLAAFASETVDEFCMGWTACAFATHQRAQREAQKIASQASQGHVGTIGQKLEAQVTIERKNSFMGNFGPTTVYNMKDANGNVLVWFNTGRGSMEVGETVTIKGTVKDHKEDRFGKSTLLTRCKVMTQGVLA